MKFVISLLAITFMSGTAFSSQISCEEQIKLTVSDWIDDDLAVRSVTPSIDFGAHAVYDLRVGLDLEDGLVGIPYAALYKILVVKEELGACSIIDASLEFEAQ